MVLKNYDHQVNLDLKKILEEKNKIKMEKIMTNRREKRNFVISYFRLLII